jgi:pimeloyl-ACP methyl ester carboxylesterase
MAETLGYEKHGHGPRQVIALHGWFGDERTYAPLYEALSPDDLTLVCPAYRGYGASRHLRGAYSVNEIAADVLALADSLGFERFSLIGHSMGGMAIQRILADASARVEKLIAVAPVPASGVPFDDQTYAAFERAVADPEAAFAIVNFSVGGKLAPYWVRQTALYPKRIAEDAAFSGYLPSWARSDFHEAIEGKTTPVLVIIGEHDGAINEALMRDTYLRWYPNAKLMVMANSGHYPMNETPLALATMIDAFLR